VQLLIVVAIVVVAVLLFLWHRGRGGAEPAPAGPQFTLSSPAFEDGGAIPAEHTCDGRNSSPPLVWTNAPEGTVSFALITEDPDAPLGTFTHWLISEMPGTLDRLPEGIPAQDLVGAPARATQGQNEFNETGYGGPCPPRGETHHYEFTLYALSTQPEMAGGFSKLQLVAAMKGYILDRAELVGTYRRQ
jgi:hypothetical protein